MQTAIKVIGFTKRNAAQQSAPASDRISNRHIAADGWSAQWFLFRRCANERHTLKTV